MCAERCLFVRVNHPVLALLCLGQSNPTAVFVQTFQPHRVLCVTFQQRPIGLLPASAHHKQQDTHTEISTSKMLSHRVQSRTCFSRAPSSRRARLNKIPTIRPNAALVESISFDNVGRLTWDVASALPGLSNTEILEGYTIRPNQVCILAAAAACWVWPSTGSV